MRALALAIVLVGGCTNTVDLLPTDGGADACTEPGAPIVLGSAFPCSGALAADTFRFGLCSCQALVLTRGLFTDGGGGIGPHPGMGAPPAAVGTDDAFEIAGPMQVGGSLIAAGTDGIRCSRTAAVLGTLRSGGPLAATQFLSVGGDAFVAGDVLGHVDVGGTLHVPSDANLSSSVAASMIAREPVAVNPPCNCAAGPPFDVAATVAAHQSANDDAHAGFAADTFASGAGPSTIDLPCGQFFLTSLAGGSTALQLLVHGRAALYVGGDVSLPSGMKVTLDPDAELDLVISGNLTVGGGTLGGTPAPSFRIWTNGSTVRLSGGATLSALLYAPSAVLLDDSDLDVTGAVVTGSVSVGGDVGVRFDARVFTAGASCGAPPTAPVL